MSRIFLLTTLPLGKGGEYECLGLLLHVDDVGDRGDSIIVTRGLLGDWGDWQFKGGGDNGISTIGDGVLVLVGIKSDCPEDRKIPFRTGHGAWFDIFLKYIFINIIFFFGISESNKCGHLAEFIKLNYSNERQNETEQKRVAFGDLRRMVERFLKIDFFFDSGTENWKWNINIF